MTFGATVVNPQENSEVRSLNDALYEERADRFLASLGRYARTSVGFTELARACSLNREALYRTLSTAGNPRLDTLIRVLDAMGMRLQVSAVDIADLTTQRAMAAKYVWWKSPNEALADFPLFAAQLMTFGTADDAGWMLESFPRCTLREALRSAPPGIFNPRSWGFWNRRLGVADVPPMPRRRIRGVSTFLPHLDVLPAAQKALWLRLVETPAEFALYGGTAVALRLGHRSSIDFDLFTSARLAADRLLAEVGYLRHCEVLQRAPDTLTVSIAIEGTRVKVSYLGGLTMGRVGRPDRAEPDSVPVASGLDLLATKLKVLLERTQEKDYLDIAHLLMSGITLRQGLGAAVALYGNQFPPMDCVKALAYFEGGDVGNLPDELKRFLIEQTDDWDLGVDEVPVLGDSLAEDPTG